MVGVRLLAGTLDGVPVITLAGHHYVSRMSTAAC